MATRPDEVALFVPTIATIAPRAAGLTARVRRLYIIHTVSGPAICLRRHEHHKRPATQVANALAVPAECRGVIQTPGTGGFAKVPQKQPHLLQHGDKLRPFVACNYLCLSHGVWFIAVDRLNEFDQRLRVRFRIRCSVQPGKPC